jgi:DNA-binding NarL/FixJ family response regulator
VGVRCRWGAVLLAGGLCLAVAYSFFPSDAHSATIRPAEVDVALLDVNMPGLNGIDTAARMAVESPGVAVLVLTMFADDASVFAALRAGARGYVLKDSSRDDLLRAIRAVARGEAIFSPSVATRVLDFFAHQHRPSIAPEDFPMLTSRERDVLHLIAQGRSNPQIAAQLGLSRKSTSTYVSAILTKLQVRDRAQAAERARHDHHD